MSGKSKNKSSFSQFYQQSIDDAEYLSDALNICDGFLLTGKF